MDTQHGQATTQSTEQKVSSSVRSYQNAPSSMQGWNDCPDIKPTVSASSSRKTTKRRQHVSHLNHFDTIDSQKKQRDPSAQLPPLPAPSTSSGPFQEYKLPPSKTVSTSSVSSITPPPYKN